MIILLSPSKTLDTTPVAVETTSSPLFTQETQKLVTQYQHYSTKQLQDHMNISLKIASQVQSWFTNYATNNSKPAIFIFKGSVYKNITPLKYLPSQLTYLQRYVRILSGLYGILRPLDLIKPYRLKMHHVTDVWKDNVSSYLDTQDDDVIVNLASQEYFAAAANTTKPVIHIVFKEKKGDLYKIIAIHAKIARGTFTNWMVLNNIEKPEQLVKFNEDGYSFSQELSGKDTLVFIRD